MNSPVDYLIIITCTIGGPKEAPVGIPGTVHSYVVPVTALAHHGTVQPQQVVMPAPIGTAVNTQNERTSLNTQQPDPPSESMLQQTRSKNGSSTVNQDLSNEESLVKSLIKDPLVTRDLRSRLQGIALKQRTTAAMRTTNSTAEDWKTNHVQGLLSIFIDTPSCCHLRCCVNSVSIFCKLSIITASKKQLVTTY